MTLETYLDQIAEYAKDLKLNLSTLLRETTLTPQQLWGTVVATGIASGNRAFSEVLKDEAKKQLTPEAFAAAQAAAAIMGMNNVYYRFTHMASHKAYASTPSRLRMNVLRSHSAPEADFELWSLAVSAINACGMCIDSHDKKLREAGVSEDAILAAVRIASVVHAIARVEV